MELNLIQTLVLLGAIAAVGVSASGQSLPVRAEFKIDGKESTQNFRIMLYADGMPVEPTVSDDGQFYVPPMNVEQVDVRFIAGKHDLFYEGVYFKKLRGRLIFGVNTKPSASDAACLKEYPKKKVVAVYSLEFEPEDAEGTEMVVSICK